MKILRRIRVTHSIPFLLFAALLGAQTQSPQAGGSKDVPDATMMAPVTALASTWRVWKARFCPGLRGQWTHYRRGFRTLHFQRQGCSGTMGCRFSSPCHTIQRPEIYLRPGP